MPRHLDLSKASIVSLFTVFDNFLNFCSFSYSEGRSSYVIYILIQKRKFPLFTCWLFYFCMQVYYIKIIARHVLSLQQNLTLIFPHIFRLLFIPEGLLFVILLVIVRALLIILSLVKKFFNCVSVFLAVRTVHVLFYLCKISTIVAICTVIVVAHPLELTYL